MNQDPGRYFMHSTTSSKIFATLPLKRTSLHSIQIHHNVVDHDNASWTTFFLLVLLDNEMLDTCHNNNSQEKATSQRSGMCISFFRGMRIQFECLKC